jgi:hypothetical protein
MGCANLLSYRNKTVPCRRVQVQVRFCQKKKFKNTYVSFPNRWHELKLLNLFVKIVTETETILRALSGDPRRMFKARTTGLRLLVTRIS